ncbi:MAG: metallophosphoesterase [candidate division Zixibacteria bacterium]|nr:metallophosphoesterase [candidate division Zixibacteria bacterium]
MPNNQIRLIRLVILLSLASAGINAVTTAAGKPAEAPIRFAILGDLTGTPNPDIYAKIVIEIERLKPDFVMTVGDMIEGPVPDTTVMNEEWREYASLVESLTPPLYFTPGNNDIFNDFSEAWYRQHVAEPYYSFDHSGLHIIILDASRWEVSQGLPAGQLQWLANDLGGSADAAYTLVFMHKPFWYETIARGEPDTLHNLFVNGGVDAVFTGHYHVYFSGMFDGIRYTSVGSSGGGMSPGPTGLGYHYTWVTVDEEGIHIAPVKMGSVLPWDELTARERRFWRTIQLSGLRLNSAVPVNRDLTVKETSIRLTVDNADSRFAIADTLRWHIPEGWKVEPQTAAVAVAAGQTATLDFDVACDGRLYPVPTATLNFTYGDAKQTAVETALRVARDVVCHRVTGKPVMDGKLSEDFWKDPVTHLFASDGSLQRVDPVRFYCAYDTENLYLAAYCEDALMDSLRGTVTEHDGPIYAEDCVGYFFEPELGQGVVYQIYINPLGTAFDQKIVWHSRSDVETDRDWNSNGEIKTVRGDDFWSMEARIPLAGLGARAEPGGKWRLNFRRKQPRYESAADWQVPLGHDPEEFGFMTIR